MTVSAIGLQGNSIQAIRAQQAFQKAVKPQEEMQKNLNMPQEEDVKVSISSRRINTPDFISESRNEFQANKNPYIGEIKDFAEKYNITDVEEDDIEDALKYGTSLFANHIA